MSERDSGGTDVSIAVNILTKKGDLFYSLAEACIVKHRLFTACTSFESIFTSSRIDLIGRLRSRPLVNGTIQKLHMLSQPLIMDLKGLKKISYHDNTSEIRVKTLTRKQ